MYEKLDYLDKIILNSKEDIEPSKNYNETIMNKLYMKNDNSKSIENSNSRKIAAYSFIMAGFLMMFIFSTDLQYNLLEAQYKVKAQVMSMQYRYSNTLDKLFYFLGE
jgi:hypothetical protein